MNIDICVFFRIYVYVHRDVSFHLYIEGYVVHVPPEDYKYINQNILINYICIQAY